MKESLFKNIHNDINKVLEKFLAEYRNDETNFKICESIKEIVFKILEINEHKYLKFTIENKEDGIRIIPSNFWTGLVLNGIYVPYLFLEDRKSLGVDGITEYFGYDDIAYSFNLETKVFKYMPYDQIIEINL